MKGTCEMCGGRCSPEAGRCWDCELAHRSPNRSTFCDCQEPTLGLDKCCGSCRMPLYQFIDTRHPAVQAALAERGWKGPT